MTYFAQIEPTDSPTKFVVVDVIAAEQEIIDSGDYGDPDTWMQTSYNTYGNKHYAPSPPAPVGTVDDGTPLRANYAGIGYTYDTSYTIDGVVGVFYSPSPFPSWVLNQTSFLWEPPFAAPSDGKKYHWKESIIGWEEYVPPKA